MPTVTRSAKDMFIKNNPKVHVLQKTPDPMFKHIPNLIAGKAELAIYALHLNEVAGSEKATPFLLKAFKIYPDFSRFV